MNQSYLKASIDGPKGSGITGTMARIALGISIEKCDRAPVVIADSNDKARFLKAMFAVEGVQLIIVPTSTLLAFHASLQRVSQEKACCWIGDDSSIPWNEAVRSFSLDNGSITFERRQQLMHVWREFMKDLRFAEFHCIVGGRLGHWWENEEDEFGNRQLIQDGPKIDAGWAENLSYAADLELKMRRRMAWITRLLFRKHKFQHILTVASDQANDLTGLNGQQFSLHGGKAYKMGDYKETFDVIRPHFDALRVIEQIKYEAPPSTRDLLVTGKLPWMQEQANRKIYLKEIDILLDQCFPSGEGRSKLAKQFREITLDEFNGSPAFEYMEEEVLTPDLERNKIVLKQMLRHISNGEIPVDKKSLLKLISISIDEVEHPGKYMTLVEAMGIEMLADITRKKINGKENVA